MVSETLNLNQEGLHLGDLLLLLVGGVVVLDQLAEEHRLILAL